MAKSLEVTEPDMVAIHTRNSSLDEKVGNKAPWNKQNSFLTADSMDASIQ